MRRTFQNCSCLFFIFSFFRFHADLCFFDLHKSFLRVWSQYSWFDMANLHHGNSTTVMYLENYTTVLKFNQKFIFEFFFLQSGSVELTVWSIGVELK